MRGILTRALLNNSPIEIIYINKNGILTQRLIRVLEINENTIKAFCMLRNKKRTFKLENVLSAAVKQERKVGLYA